jgi:hypothetical protein
MGRREIATDPLKGKLIVEVRTPEGVQTKVTTPEGGDRVRVRKKSTGSSTMGAKP